MGQAVIKIPPELFAMAESSSFQGELDLPELQVGPDDYAFARPVEWSVEVSNTGGAFYVQGRAQGVATCACARCLEPAEYELLGDIEGYFLVEGGAPEAADEDGSEGDEPLEDEFLVLPADHLMDLEPLICAALALDAPEVPLCRDDCAGLCPQCGANLNEGPCGCGPDPELEEFARQSNPFAALADFKFD